MIRASGFSTLDLPGLLGNLANKLLIDSFLTVDSTYPIIADQAEFSSFHKHAIYRLESTATSRW